MKKTTALSHRFVEFIPEKLEDGILYVSLEYATAVHKCCCGCGNEVITPLAPTDWRLIFNGESISLYPSIGNWSFPCRSHYWVDNNRVLWSWKWTQQEINEGRVLDSMVKKKYYSKTDLGRNGTDPNQEQNQPKLRLLHRILRRLF